MRRIFDSPQGLFWLTWTKCPPRQNQWFQPFFEGDLFSFKGRLLIRAAQKFKAWVQNLGQRLPLQFSDLPKWRSRSNQWFQLTSLGNILELTG